jgi:hypothetical protein
MSTALEERTVQAYQQSALAEVKTEHPKYFEAIETHPRLLVGTKVPGLNGAEDEVLRTTEDAREWQEAARHVLVAEIRDRAGKQLEENRGYLDTVHASIELFQNNPDLVPGTKDFDVELAKRLTTLAEPYEIRHDGKLQGYSIRVQPLIDQIRAQVASERTAAAAAPSTTAAAAAPPAAARVVDPPQAGITSKAGGGGDAAEDFSTLFSTINPALADFQI